MGLYHDIIINNSGLEVECFKPSFHKVVGCRLGRTR